MDKQSGQLREKCVWWVCTLVALVPVMAVVIIWLMFFR